MPYKLIWEIIKNLPSIITFLKQIREMTSKKK